MSDAEALFETRGPTGAITLNRPKALNALTLGMVRLIAPQLESWAKDPAIERVVIEGAGDRAFCAGGDIRALHDWGRAGDRQVIDFYREEYRLNRAVKTFPKPYVAIINGIDMGGGVGLSVHGSLRVATEKLTFAMPETGIGLFPDVGGTYFLPRCQGEIGMFLGLTGTRLKAADAIYAGIADIYIPSERLLQFMEALAGKDGEPAELAKPFVDDPGPPSLAEHREEIDRHFSGKTLVEVLASLEGGSDWAKEQAATIRTKSPLSCAIAFRQIREGKTLSFDDCMKLEFRLTNRFMKGHDFYEGVRAVIIDKDQAPVWQPASLEEVTGAEIDAYFASLGADELTFSD